VRHVVFSGLVVAGIGLLLSSQALAFKLNNSDWSYMSHPMGENLVICPDRMPGGAVERTKDGALVWNYDRFHFIFASEACLSNGVFPALNSVNQIDFGQIELARFPLAVLAQTVSFFFTDAPDQTVECDSRFNSAVQWYTGTERPSANQFDWWSVATHELGHCLGLAHEDSVTPLPVMQTRLPIGFVMRQLTTDDIAGRSAIYDQPRGNAGDAPAPASPAPTTAGGGGGCSLVPGSPTDASSLGAALGNIFLPLVVMVVVRVGSRRRG